MISHRQILIFLFMNTFYNDYFSIFFHYIVTVICTTCMSLGLSGVSLNMNSKISLVPYLVAFISLENVLAITQSVISTPGHLDVKIRIAQGLSKEGTIHSIIYSI